MLSDRLIRFPNHVSATLPNIDPLVLKNIGHRNYRRIVSRAPVMSGTDKLSLTGNGRVSTTIPRAAPTIAEGTFKKQDAPAEANTKPDMEPSKFFPLLKGIEAFPKNLPKMDAALSPSEITAIEA